MSDIIEALRKLIRRKLMSWGLGKESADLMALFMGIAITMLGILAVIIALQS